MSKRRKRDIYGNWTWSDDEDSEKLSSDSAQDHNQQRQQEEEQRDLDWRDYIAISIASLETILLPIVAFTVILVVLSILFTHGWI